MEQYLIEIKDDNCDIILTQAVYIEGYEEYLKLLDHARKLRDFFGYNSSYSMNRIEDRL